MDFDKIKKAAKDTIRMVSNKVEEKLSSNDDEEVIEVKPPKSAYDDFDDFTENDDILGTTQRFDMKDALNRFRKHKEDIEETISDLVKDADEKENEVNIVNEFIENNFSDLKNDITDIDTDISNLSQSYSQQMTKINNDLVTLKKNIENIFATSETTGKALSELSGNLETSIIDINKKLSEISSAISGVNRINDSIFDLKNTQVNTKNFLGELDVSFKKLKKKMIAGISILSIISAIIAILEVINLLS